MACYGRATLHRVAFIVEVGLIVRQLDGVGPLFAFRRIAWCWQVCRQASREALATRCLGTAVV